MQKRFYKIAEKMYAEAQANGGAQAADPNAAGNASQDGGSVSVDDYQVDDDNNK